MSITTTDINYRPKYEEIPTFQILNKAGALIDKSMKFESAELSIYKDILQKMIELETIDTILLKAKFQGTFSFYMASYGENGTVIGATAGCEPTDMLMTQYREFGALYYRGFSLKQLTDNLLGNKNDIVKGRQMPIHFTNKDKNFFTISSPLATNISQAAGYGYGLARRKENRIAVTIFGDGAASEGDFYAAINFAQTLKTNTMFICRNNEYAISTHISEQTSGDGILPKALAFGMEAVRVDGNDTVAVYRMTKQLRNYIVSNQRPAFIEAMTYRISDHSTTDKSTKYRTQKDIDDVKSGNNPITRLANFLKEQGALGPDWDEQMEQTKKKLFAELNDCLRKSIKEKQPKLESLFDDVYSELTQSLLTQRTHFLEHVARNKEQYTKLFKLDHHET